MNLPKVLEVAKDAITDPDAIIDPYDLTFAWVSKKCSELTGFTKQELMNKQIFVVCPKYKSPKEIEKNMLFDPTCDREVPIVTKDGKEISFRLMSQLIKVEKDPYCVGKIMSVIE